MSSPDNSPSTWWHDSVSTIPEQATPRPCVCTYLQVGLDHLIVFANRDYTNKIYSTKQQAPQQCSRAKLPRERARSKDYKVSSQYRQEPVQHCIPQRSSSWLRMDVSQQQAISSLFGERDGVFVVHKALQPRSSSHCATLTYLHNAMMSHVPIYRVNRKCPSPQIIPSLKGL